MGDIKFVKIMLVNKFVFTFLHFVGEQMGRVGWGQLQYKLDVSKLYW